MLRTIALAAALLGAAPAFGQTQPAVMQPETAVVSPGGVDMNSGQYRFEGTDLSVGSEGNGGITVTRVKQSNKPFTTNWHIFLNRDCDRAPGSIGRPESRPCTTTWKLESMAVAKSWLEWTPGQLKEQGIPSPGMTSLQHSAGRWQFTMADGTLLQFESGSQGSGDVWATSMTRKDGVAYTFAYDSGGDPKDGNKRLRRVTSNTGYEAIFEYEGDFTDLISKACVYNTSVVAPEPANSCPVGVQTVTYGTGLSSITDVMGKVWTINRSSTVHSYYKPGYPSTPYMVNNIGSAPNGGFWEPPFVVLNQQLPDGRTIAYDYANLLVYESDGLQTDLRSGRGMGWTVNGTQNTQVGWAVVQQNMGGQPGPLYISPAPNVVIDPLGRVSGATFEGGFSPFGNALSKTLIGGRKEEYTYVGTSTGGTNLASRKWVPSTTVNGETPITTAYTYNCSVSFNCAKPETITDPKNNVSNYTYDPTNGLLLTETMPDPDDAGPQARPQKRYTWIQKAAYYQNGPGSWTTGTVWVIDSISECRTSASCAGTADETRTTFVYPAPATANNLLPISRTVKAGNNTLIATTTFTYDAAGNKLTEDGPLSGTADTSRWQYDAKRRVTATMTPDPDGSATTGVPLAVRNTYDDAGRLTKVENGSLPNQATTWGSFAIIDYVETDYDILDRKVQERKKDAAGAIQALTQYSYDSFGRLDCAAVRMNKAVYGSLPTSACSQSTGAGQSGIPHDRITRNSYDAGDQLMTVTEAVGTSDQAVEASSTYTASGKKETLTDARGYKAQMVYDGHDRQTEWRFPDKVSLGLVSSGIDADYEKYTYDNNGNRTLLRKRDGSTLTFDYDILNRMTVKTVPGSTPTTRDVYMNYDLQGHQISARFDNVGGEGLASIYDALGRLTSATLTMDGVGRTLTYGYDIRGFRTSLTHPDSTVFTYIPDTLGRLTALTQGATTLRGFGYDGNGRLTASPLGSGTPGSSTFGYDTIGRLTGLSHNIFGTAADVTFGFSYSPASQTLTQSRDNDSYAWIGAVPVTRNYTANGLNQYTAAGTATFTYDANGNLTNDGTNAYVYDVENRLVSATIGGQAVTLRYDPMGRLYQVTGATTTRFLYDGDELVAEYDANNAMLKRYVHGIAVDDPVIQYDGSGLASTALRHLLADRQGSVIGLADSNGAIIAKNTYDEYGIPKSDQAGQAVVGRFAYTGQIWLPEIGMYHYKARLYSPTLGRFLQTDPIGYDDQINLYAYVGNDPANHVDPTGRDCVDIVNRGSCRNIGKAADSRSIISSPENDKGMIANGQKYESAGGEDGGFRVDGSTLSPIGQGGETSKLNTVTMQPEETEGADVVGHPHDNDIAASTPVPVGKGIDHRGDSLNAGPGDISNVAKSGKPQAIVHTGRVMVIEQSRGTTHVRVIEGKQTFEEREMDKRRGKENE